VPSLVASRVSFAYSDAVPLIRELSLDLHPGWTGVVGANGAGKTTLLRLLAGELEPDEGRVQRRPASLRSRVCPQTVEVLEADILAFAAASEGGAQRLRGQLALDPLELERWSSLSPGERKRWQVGAALFDEPQLLILDEPTNHLDAAARGQLLAALAGFPGVGLVVSHDRTLLDALTTTTLRFERGGVRAWRGGYSAARAAWEEEEREQIEAYGRLQSEKRKLRRRLADARQKRAEAEAHMKRKMRRASIKDIDTRKRFSAKRRRSAEVSLGWEVHKLHGRLDRVEERAAVFDLAKARGRSLFVDWEPAPVATLLSLDTDRLRAGERDLVADVHVRVERGSRIHLCGDNGAGKTTLVQALLEAPHVPPSRILHLPQEQSADEGARLLAELRQAAEALQGRILAILAALGVDPEALLASASPSPGEARKIALAGGLARSAWLLVLDEPTNHLDLPSIERIEQALAAYPGALLVVTHDDAFAQRCTSTQWRLRAGRLEVSGRDA
jgi:ATPase subunit of ABC transporter with duplicated ATPase domains